MLLTLLFTAAAAVGPAPRFDAIQMMKLQRLADPQLSPDGKWVAYQATDVALDAGTRNTDIWIVSADGHARGAPPSDRPCRRRHAPALEPRRPPHRVRVRARRRVAGLRRPRGRRRGRRR